MIEVPVVAEGGITPDGRRRARRGRRLRRPRRRALVGARGPGGRPPRHRRAAARRLTAGVRPPRAARPAGGDATPGAAGLLRDIPRGRQGRRAAEGRAPASPRGFSRRFSCNSCASAGLPAISSISIATSNPEFLESHASSRFRPVPRRAMPAEPDRPLDLTQGGAGTQGRGEDKSRLAARGSDVVQDRFLAVSVSQDNAEIDRAVAICDALGAHLAVLVVGVAPPPPASPYGVVSNDIWAEDIRDGQDDVEARGRAIEKQLGGTACPPRSRRSISTGVPWRRWPRALHATPT